MVNRIYFLRQLSEVRERELGLTRVTIIAESLPGSSESLNNDMRIQ